MAKVKRLLSVRQHQTRSAVTQKIRQFWALLAITAAQIWLHLIGMVWLPEARPTVSQQWRQGSIAIHTHPFNGPLSGTIRSAGTRKVKPIWILLKQETVSGSGISWAICKSATHSRQITTPVRHHSIFYRPDALPATQPTASKHWRQKRSIAIILS